jgi:transcriptional regulator with XRE-family HTH domain
MERTRPPFGEAMRHWRRRRGRAQLELAFLTGYSQRHISFLESGRSRPSRASVLAIAEALAVPLRERNALLQAAGFAPVFTAEPLDSQSLAAAARALERLLESHRPFPAIVIDRAWNMYAANPPMLALLGRLSNAAAAFSVEQPVNVIELCLDPNALRPAVRNWSKFARGMVARLKRELDLDAGNEALARLVASLEADPELSRAGTATEAVDTAPFGVLELARGAEVFRLFSLISHIGNPLDSTLSELRLETFLPADDTTRQSLEALDAAQPADSVHWLRRAAHGSGR